VVNTNEETVKNIETLSS